MSMPGKQPRVLCPVCQEPIPPDDTVCRNCGAFVIVETEAEGPAAEEEDILDLVLCPVCGADNDPEVVECEICGAALREAPTPKPVPATSPAMAVPTPKAVERERALEKVDIFLEETERPLLTPAPLTPREQPPKATPRPIPKSPAPIPPARAPSFASKPKEMSSPPAAKPAI